MEYSLTAISSQQLEGEAKVGSSEIKFGVTKESQLPSPAELLVAAFASCCLKNVQRFSEMMRFEYDSAEITVSAERQDKPPMINVIKYEIKIYSSDSKLNMELLHRNLQKFGTIYNTLNSICDIRGEIKIVK